MKRSLIITLLFVCFMHLAKAEVVLPARFGNCMVLQQKEAVSFWGKAKPNASLLIVTSWNKKTYTVKVKADGSWKTSITTPSAGGPFSIMLNDGKQIILSDVLIGEVWVCSGQSNMEMPVKGFGNQPILNANDILLEAEDPGVRLFRIEKNMSRAPLTSIQSKWEHTDAKSVKEFSGGWLVYYH